MATDMDTIQKLQSEIACIICQNYFSQSVTMDCGHCFCLECLSKSWRLESIPSSCPICKEISQIGEFPAFNGRLEKLTDIDKQLSSHSLQSSEGPRCPTHKEVLQYFCEEDQILLCLICCQMPEHESHKLSPIEEATHNYRKKLQKMLSHVKKDFEETKKLHSQKGKVKTPFVDWGQMIAGEYYRLYSFLMEEKSQCLKRMKKEQKSRKDRITRHIQNLQEIMLELQESSQKPQIDLLQDLRRLLKRSTSVLSQKPETVVPELREYPIAGIIDVLNKFKVDIRVHPDSESSYITISEDLKSMRAGQGWKVESNQPEESVCHYAFAEQVFTSGRHYWEIDVSQVPQWALGIYSPHLKRRRRKTPTLCASMFLLRCVKKEDHYMFQSYPKSLNHREKGPVPRIGEQKLEP
ncbi:tripartite motif-containing protein 43-like [Antechinus flavipes]|uniref:tripartite motif-containing protein 43-like n=1 Tax=Antechinus flavipes TaxID=38775 RepID=UPI002235DF53|nr:tripartite motif-containing protein 43-like [Antechinus flavipes]